MTLLTTSPEGEIERQGDEERAHVSLSTAVLPHIRTCPGAPAWRMPLRIWEATSLTAPALCGKKTVDAFVLAAMSRRVSKYCVMSRSSEIFWVDKLSSDPWVMESRKPSMMALRCRAIPSP